MAELGDVARAGEELPDDTDVAWTGRTMKVPWFAEHMREELVLHGWDITGDGSRRPRAAWRALDDRAQRRGRLRVPDGDDVIVSAAVDHTDIALAAAEGEATLETDAATRVLLLWGRRPGDPSRIRSRVGPRLLGQVRTLLSGY